MSIHRGLLWVAFLLAVGAARAGAAEADAMVDDQSTYVEAIPALGDYARAHGIPMDGIKLANRAEEAKPGDTVVLLVTFFERESYEQWLVSLRTDVLTESERERKPPSEIVLHTITGQILNYPGAWTALTIRTIGPFPQHRLEGFSDTIRDRHSRALVRTSFLNLGFDRSCLFIMRTRSKLKLAGQANPGGIDPAGVLSWSVKPFPPDKVEQGEHLAAEIGMTPEDDRQVGGVTPALAAFLRAVEKVPGLPEKVLRIVAMPSLWSVIREGHLEAGIALKGMKVDVIPGNRWGLPFPVYRLPFELRLNETPTLDCSLAVTEPRRPLLTCAGILGISASNPGNPAMRMSARVLATRATP